MKGLLGIGLSTLLSGGILGNGTLGSYLSDSARRAIGMGLAELQDGQVHYFSKNADILGRALIQIGSQTAYGLLRSYPRYLKYWEQKVRDKYLTEVADSVIANKTGQYYTLISEQKARAPQKNYADKIVGNPVQDYLELTLDKEGTYYDKQSGKVEPNSKYGLETFVDLQPHVQLSSKNNIVLTTVQGRDYTRKEFVSGGDVEFSITGKITSKYPDLYPEGEVTRFLRLVQYKGVIDCDHTVLRQLGIGQLIVLNYALQHSECRNVQPYTISCVAVEPDEPVKVTDTHQEAAEYAIEHTNKWIKWVKFGAEVVDPTSILKLNRLWL